MPAVVQIIDSVLGILADLCRIQLALVLRQPIVVAELPIHHKISTLILRAIINSQLRIAQRNQSVP